eukprot:scaffold105433_cov31-Tisochrysis_lutea.AAC.1
MEYSSDINYGIQTRNSRNMACLCRQWTRYCRVSLLSALGRLHTEGVELGNPHPPVARGRWSSSLILFWNVHST